MFVIFKVDGKVNVESQPQYWLKISSAHVGLIFWKEKKKFGLYLSDQGHLSHFIYNRSSMNSSITKGALSISLLSAKEMVSWINFIPIGKVRSTHFKLVYNRLCTIWIPFVFNKIGKIRIKQPCIFKLKYGEISFQPWTRFTYIVAWWGSGLTM